MNFRLLLLIALAVLAAMAFGNEKYDNALLEADADVDMDLNVDADADEELDDEDMVDEDANEEDAPEAFLEVEDEPVKIPATHYMHNSGIGGVVQLPIAALNSVNPTPDPYDLVKVSSDLGESINGWALREQGAIAPINATDLYSLAYERIDKKVFNPFLISKNYNIRGYTYVLVPGFGQASNNKYFKPVESALESFGVHPMQVKTLHIDYEHKSTIDNAAHVFKAMSEIFTTLHNQTIVVVTHANGIVPFHAAYALYPEMASFVHGVIPLNPVWGGSVLATRAMPAQYSLDAAAVGFKNTSVALNELTYGSRMEFVRKYPVDYNALRIMTVSTHDEQPVGALAKTTAYIKAVTKELNDGVTTLSDQLIPGSRTLLLSLGHNDLVLPVVPDYKFNQITAIQSVFYTFFKTTP